MKTRLGELRPCAVCGAACKRRQAVVAGADGSAASRTADGQLHGRDELTEQARAGSVMREVTSELTAKGARLFRVNGKPILIRGGGWSQDMLLRSDAKQPARTIRVWCKRHEPQHHSPGGQA